MSYAEISGSVAFENPSSFAVRDEFNQSAGALNGKAMAVAQLSAGPNDPATLATVDTGLPDVVWTNPANAATSNNVYATSAVTSSAASERLHATNFGFAVPVGATVNGIKVEVERSKTSTAAGISDTLAASKLIKGGTIQGNSKAILTDWTTGDQYVSYGGPNDLWGLAFTPADINAANFGFAIQASVFSGTGTTARIDHIRITVFYTPAAAETWASAGDADDFTIEATGHTARRTAVSDANLDTGRYATAGSQNYAATGVQVDCPQNTTGATSRVGALARFVDTNNWLFAGLEQTPGAIKVYKRVAGTVTLLASIPWATTVATGPTLTVRLVVTAGGTFFVWAFPRGSTPGSPILVGYDAVLQTGGALDDGKVGFYDAQTTAGAATRDYDNFAAFIPATDAAIFGNGQLEVRHDRSIRLAEGVWESVQVVGDHLLIPPAGKEGRTVRIMVKASRTLLDAADPGIDDIQATLHVTPRYLSVPEA